MRKWRIAGINFDHMHMGDNLRMAFEHPNAEIVALCDEEPKRMAHAAKTFDVSPDKIFTDHVACLEKTKPDLVLLCPATARHGEWIKKVAPFNVHVIMEKPFAASLAEADGMIETMKPTGKLLAINWPLRWYPPFPTTKRLIDEGVIGDVLEFHYYGGNRGPLYHVADKIAVSPEEVAAQKPHSWFYKKSHGGGSLLDYMGYGATLGTWFQHNREPVEVSCVVDEPAGLEVDEHSITILRYAHGLSKIETRWGTFTDPWTHQPQPKCGFVVVGTHGTIAAYDSEKTIRVQTRAHPEGRKIPVDIASFPLQNPVQYVLDCIEKSQAVEGPLCPKINRIGQRIVDSAVISAREKRTVKLLD